MTICGVIWVVVFISTADAIWRDSGRNHVIDKLLYKIFINIVVWSIVRHSAKAAELLLCHTWPLSLLPVERMRVKQALFYLTRYIWKLCYNCILFSFVNCLIKHIKYYNVFGVSMFSTKQNRKSRVYDAIAGDARTLWSRSISLVKMAYFLGDLKILQNIWDNVSA